MPETTAATVTWLVNADRRYSAPGLDYGVIAEWYSARVSLRRFATFYTGTEGERFRKSRQAKQRLSRDFKNQHQHRSRVIPQGVRTTLR